MEPPTRRRPWEGKVTAERIIDALAVGSCLVALAVCMAAYYLAASV